MTAQPGRAPIHQEVSAKDTLDVLAESATKSAQTFIRTGSDTIAAPVETATKGAQSFSRTTTDSLGALAESVSKAAQSFARTAGDKLLAIMDLAADVRDWSLMALRIGGKVVTVLKKAVPRGHPQGSSVTPEQIEAVARRLAAERQESWAFRGRVDPPPRITYPDVGAFLGVSGDTVRKRWKTSGKPWDF